MSEVFISYSRKDQTFVEHLVRTLETARIDNWVDREDIEPAADWRERIQRGIEKANNFIFVISPTSIQSNECKRELEWAIQNGKRLIPIVIKEVDPQSIHPALAALNWIYFRSQVDDFQQAFTKLVEAIKTDLNWAETHSRLQTRALEWRRKGHDSSFLLRGKDLQDAEEQLAGVGPNKDPQPTKLQRQYVLSCRKDATMRQRRSFSAISIALVLVVGLAILAFILRGVAAAERDQKATAQVRAENAEGTAVVERDQKATAQVQAENAEGTAVVERDLKATAQVIAETQRDLAISRQLAAQARLLIADQLDLGLLLAIEASLGSSDGLLSLSDLLQAEPGLVRIVSGAEGYIWKGPDMGFIDSLALSQDGSQLVAKSYLGAIFWDLNTMQSRPLDAGQYQQYWDAWSRYQEQAPVEPEQFQVLDAYRFIGPSTKASKRKAFSACRTIPAAGGAPGCASLIYIFEDEIDPLISRRASCSPAATPHDFTINLEGGLFTIPGAQTIAGQPAGFELYSVELANKASNQGSILSDSLYDPQNKWLVTAAAVERFYSELALIVWDLDEKKQVLELFTDLWGSEYVQLHFSNAGTVVNICGGDIDIQVDLNPDSWREKACKIAGRNLTHTEWRQFFGDRPYHQTCPQWP